MGAGHLMLKSLSLADKSNAAHVFAHRLVICVISHKLVVLNVHLKSFHHLILFHLFCKALVSYSSSHPNLKLVWKLSPNALSYCQ